jgi:hypothetical protein
MIQSVAVEVVAVRATGAEMVCAATLFVDTKGTVVRQAGRFGVVTAHAGSCSTRSREV